MATRVKEMAKQALDKLPEDEAVEVLDFISFHWATKKATCAVDAGSFAFYFYM